MAGWKGTFTPTEWLPQGEALVRASDPRGRQIAIWQGIPGEAGQVELGRKGAHRQMARWVGARSPSPHRVTPPCPRYHSCGGCPLMHVDARGQSHARLSLLESALREAGIDSPAPEGEIGPGVLSHYRHVMKLAADETDRGHLRIGAPGGYSRRVVPIPECSVVTPGLHNVMHAFVRICIDLEIRPYVRGRGLLRNLVARESSSTGEILITLVVGQNHPLLRDVADRLTGRCEKVVGAHLHINGEEGNAIFWRDEEGNIPTSHLVGRKTITDRLADVDFRIGPVDFFQTNPIVADRIYRDVLEMTGVEESGAALVDLYCGVGGFALAAASRSSWSLGVESVGSAVKQARESASVANLPAEFMHGQVTDVLAPLKKRLSGHHPVVVLNPARRGLENGVLDGVLDLDPASIVYVSCNPKALARDLAQFVARDWTIKRIVPYEMFPNTPHLEVVALLEPPGGEQTSSRRAPRRKVVR